MTFIGVVLSFVIPLFILASGVYALLKLIKRWNNYKHSILKVLGFVSVIGIILFIGALWLLIAISFSSVDILTRPSSDATFNLDKGVAQVEMETFIGEYRGASIFGSGGYENKWMTLNRKTILLECYIGYYPLRTGNKMTLSCPGKLDKYIMGFSGEIYPDDQYINTPSYCSDCANFRVSDFTSRGYQLPDENNMRVNITPR